MVQLIKHAQLLQKCTLSSFFSTNLQQKQMPPYCLHITSLQTLQRQLLCPNWQFRPSLEYTDQGEDEISLSIFERFNDSINSVVYVSWRHTCKIKEHRKIENPHIVFTPLDMTDVEQSILTKKISKFFFFDK